MKKMILFFTLLSSVALYADLAYTRGVKSYNTKQYTEALRYFYVSARNHNVNAYAKLGSMHEYGVGTAKNPQIAFYWYEKSAQSNHAESQYRLGYLYESGVGVKKDTNRASRWYHRAANNGNKDAKARLAGKSVKVKSISKTDENNTNKLMFWKAKKTEPVKDQNRTIEQNVTLTDKLIFWR